MDVWVYVCMECMNEWMDMNGWLGGWMDGWMYEMTTWMGR